MWNDICAKIRKCLIVIPCEFFVDPNKVKLENKIKGIVNPQREFHEVEKGHFSGTLS